MALALTGAATAQATTTESGAYHFTLYDAGAYALTPTLQGSVNGISAFDAAYIAQCTAGVRPTSECPLLAADASGNGSISSLDAAQIAQYVAGIAGPTSRVGAWVFDPASRTYPAINSDLTAEHFAAYLVGDVTGNWQPPVAARTSSGQQRAPLTVTARGADAVTLALTGVITDLFAYQLTVHYDPAGGQFVTATPASTAADSGWSFYVHEGSPGVVAVVGYGVTARRGDGELLTLQFQPIPDAPAPLAPTVVQLQLNEQLVWFGPVTAQPDEDKHYQFFLPLVGN